MEKKGVSMMMIIWVLGFAQIWAGNGLDYANVSKIEHLQSCKTSVPNAEALMVDLTLIQGADSKGAVCLDGTLPGYHFDPGFGSGADNWLIDLEGGGWCNDIKSCVDRKTSTLGSSDYMGKQYPFGAILSNKKDENPDFYNWNRVHVRYCDGASFAGEGEDKENNLYFRGQRIWSVVMEELMAKGLKNANQALLSGCSAGGLASILHCDQFRDLLPASTKVKCLSDAGFFLDAVDISGKHGLREVYNGTVTLQGAEKNLPASCKRTSDPTSCFFPENIIADIKTPMFLLNSAYDFWQVEYSIAPSWKDPTGEWAACTKDLTRCSPSQIQFLQGFRNQMLNAVNKFSQSKQNGLFINSCYAHCESVIPDLWFSNVSPVLQNKKIATAVGDWYFDRSEVKLIECPYPCGKSCPRTVDALGCASCS